MLRNWSVHGRNNFVHRGRLPWNVHVTVYRSTRSRLLTFDQFFCRILIRSYPTSCVSFAIFRIPTLCFLFSCILNQIINFPKPTSYILLSQTYYELHNNYKGKQIYFWVEKKYIWRERDRRFSEKKFATSQIEIRNAVLRVVHPIYT